MRECHLECSPALPACKIFITFFPSLSAVVFEMDLEHIFLLDTVRDFPPALYRQQLQTSVSTVWAVFESIPLLLLKATWWFILWLLLVKSLGGFFFAITEWLTVVYLNVISWPRCFGLVCISWWFCSWGKYRLMIIWIFFSYHTEDIRVK